MKKTLLTFLFLATLTSSMFSQDIITKKSGDDIMSKILEVNQSEIRYKKYDNITGPTFTILKSDVMMVRYENGTKDIFNEVSSPSSTSTQMENPSLKGRMDASKNYTGRNSGAIWTGVTTALTSPILGIIPAIACSAAVPSQRNLEITDPELMKNPDYNAAYKNQAHKTKKARVWSSFGIGCAVWGLFLVLAQ